jgi:hypothetical protein
MKHATNIMSPTYAQRAFVSCDSAAQLVEVRR